MSGGCQSKAAVDAVSGIPVDAMVDRESSATVMSFKKVGWETGILVGALCHPDLVLLCCMSRSTADSRTERLCVLLTASDNCHHLTCTYHIKHLWAFQ